MDLWPEDMSFGRLDDLFEQRPRELRDRYGLVRIHAVTEEAYLKRSDVHGNQALRLLDPGEHARLWQTALRAGMRPPILLPFLFREAEEEELLAQFQLTPEELHAKVESSLKGRVGRCP